MDALEQIPSRLAAGADVAITVADVFRGVEQTLLQMAPRDGELKHVREHPSYVPPVPRYLGARVGKDNQVLERFHAYDAPLGKTLESMFATRPDLWTDVESFKARVSQRMRTSEKYDESAMIGDIIDGIEFGLFYRRVKLQDDETPLMFIFYYDGLEVVNGLGQARLTHELACF